MREARTRLLRNIAAIRVGALFLVVSLYAGCVPAGAPLEMTSFDPSHDQWAIAGYYHEQAQAMRQRASELRNTAELYEDLFGPDSAEVRSTRMLAEFYEEAARQRESAAQAHAEVSRAVRGPLSMSTPMP